MVKSLYEGYLYNVNNRDDFIKSNEIHKAFTLPRITSSYLRQAVWERYIREHQDIKYIGVAQSDALGTCYHLGPREKG